MEESQAFFFPLLLLSIALGLSLCHSSIGFCFTFFIPTVNRYTEVLSDLINFCIQSLSSHMFVSPREKYAFVRIACFCVFLIDNDKDPQFRLDRSCNLRGVIRLVRVCGCHISSFFVP